MTDITELEQREKFEAWWERTQHNGNPPRFGWECWRDGEGYKVDDDESELDGMWEAWKAAGAELVEALELKEEQVDEELCKLLPPGIEYMDPPDGGDVTPLEGVRRMVADYRQRIAELESRTVTVKLPDYRNTYKSPLADEVEHQVRLALELFSYAAGIKWEAE